MRVVAVVAVDDRAKGCNTDFAAHGLKVALFRQTRHGKLTIFCLLPLGAFQMCKPSNLNPELPGAFCPLRVRIWLHWQAQTFVKNFKRSQMPLLLNNMFALMKTEGCWWWTFTRRGIETRFANAAVDKSNERTEKHWCSSSYIRVRKKPWMEDFLTMLLKKMVSPLIIDAN